MLPFLSNKDKKVSGLILETRRTPDEKPDGAPEDGNAPLHAAAEDILRAIASKDPKHLALALQAAYDICESAEPKDEESDEPQSKHDYDAQAQE